MSTVNQEIRELKAQIGDLAAALEKSMKKSNGRASVEDTFHLDADEIRNMAKRAGNNVREFLHEKSEAAAKIRDEYEHRVAAHPYQAIAASALAGIVLGLLFRK